jgi:hypothetical protein
MLTWLYRFLKTGRNPLKKTIKKWASGPPSECDSFIILCISGDNQKGKRQEAACL